MSVSVGNTIMQYKVIFDGCPFSSTTRNKEVLTALLSEMKCEIKIGKNKEEEELVVAEFSSEEIEGHSGRIIQTVIQNDQFTITFLFPPQGISNLAKEVSAPNPLADQIRTKLSEVYNLSEKSLEVICQIYSFETSNVPCLSWLRKQLKSCKFDLGFENSLNEGFSPAEEPFRLVKLAFAAHAVPQGLKDAPKNVQRKVETINLFEISVGSTGDWEKGFGNVSGRVRDAKPALFLDFVRHITSN